MGGGGSPVRSVGGRYLLSGGDGDPPDAVHVGRVAVGEFGGGEVALAVLERLPTGCRGGKSGGQTPSKPPLWVALGSEHSLLPPLLVFFYHPKDIPAENNSKKPQTAPGDAPGSPAPPRKHQTPGGGPPEIIAPVRAGFRGWIQPSVTIWKPHDAAATAHGARLRLSRGQGGHPPTFHPGGAAR